MKIGIVLKNYRADIGGGYEYQDAIVRGLINNSTPSRHEFVLLLEEKSANILSNSRNNIYIHHIYNSNKIFCFFQRFLDYFSDKMNDFGFPQIIRKRLEKIARKKGIELLFFPQPEHSPVSIPYITTVWDLQHRIQPWFPELVYNGEWERRDRITFRRLSKAYRIMTGTEEGKEQIRSLYSIPAERIVVNPFPVLQDNSSQLDNREIESIISSYCINSPYYLYPAQFWAHKNHILLIDTLTILKETYGYYPVFVFVGSDKGNLDYIRVQIKRKELEENIIITGFIPRMHLNALYARAEGLIYPSWFGPDNLPPIEATISGCPVIASRSSGAMNQLGDGCLIFDPLDPHDCAEKIYSLVNDPQLRESIIQMGRKKAYSWTISDFVDQLLFIIDDFEPIRRCWGTQE